MLNNQRPILLILLLLLHSHAIWAQWAGQTSSGDLNSPISRTGMVSIDAYNQAQIRLNSSGTYYGKIGSPTEQLWSLGYGAGGSDITSVLNWTAAGNVGVGINPSYKLDVYAPEGQWKARFSGPDGYITIGPANNGWAHIYTDRNAFIFNKDLWTFGAISSYNTADLSLQTHGTPRIHVLNANGNVGVGTVAAEGKLTIQQIGSGWNDGLRINRDATNYLTLTEDVNDIRLKNWGSGGILFFSAATEVARFTSGGLVGIGTSAPAYKLDVSGTIRSTDYINATNYISVFKPGSGSYRVALNAQNGDGYLAGRNDALQDKFLITANGNSFFTGGNVGVGVSSPQTLLNVNLGAGDPTVGTAALRIGGTNNYQSLELGIKGNYDGMISTFGNDLHIYAGNWRSAGVNATENHNISFYTSQSGSNNWNTPKMYLRYDGRLGIGTSTPATALDVNGGVTVQSNNNLTWGGTYGPGIPTIAGVVNNGLYFYGTGSTSNISMHINNSGNVGIGTTNTGSYKLAVEGKIWSKEVNVKMTNPGPDYVFEKDYPLLSLSDVEKYIHQHKHLPEVPSAKEMEDDGLNLKEMNLLLLKKVEELTLHLIELQKQTSLQQRELESIKSKIK
jgi:hypothetical protein